MSMVVTKWEVSRTELLCRSIEVILDYARVTERLLNVSISLQSDNMVGFQAT